MIPNGMIEAELYIPIVRPFSQSELQTMPSDEAKIIKNFGTMKIAGEEPPEKIEANHREKLEKVITERCLQISPRPLFVRLNSTLDRTFIVDKKYHQHVDSSVIEVIHFGYDQTGQQIQKTIADKMRLWYNEVHSEFGLTEEDIIRFFRHGEINSRSSNSGNPHHVFQKITEQRYNVAYKIYLELVEKFGVKKPFTITKRSAPYERMSDSFGYFPAVYTTTSELALREQYYSSDEFLFLYSLLFDYIEEKGRFIQQDMMRNSASIDYIDYYRKTRPELIGPYSTTNMIFRVEEVMDFRQHSQK